MAPSNPENHDTTDPDDWDSHWSAYHAAVETNPAFQFRHDLVARLLTDFAPVNRFVDLGSGIGDLLYMIDQRRLADHLLGVELSETGVRLAGRKVPGARFVQHDLLEDVEIDADLRGWATHATCTEVLEHVVDPIRLLTNARHYLAPGARLIVTVPSGPMNAYERHIGHLRHYTPSTLRDLLIDAGLEVDAITRHGFPFFNLYKVLGFLRGTRLIEDIDERDGSVSKLTTLSMKLLGPGIRRSGRASRFGWQLIAVTTNPSPTTDLHSLRSPED